MCRLRDVVEINRVAEGVFVQNGDAVQLPLPSPQLVDVGLAGHAPERAGLIDEVAQAVVKPLARMPVRHVDRRKQAHAMEVDASIHGRQALLDDVAEPFRPAVPHAACLADDHGAAVTLPGIGEQVPQRPYALVIGREGCVGAVLAIFHLAERVAVHPHDIEGVRRTAKFRMLPAGDHVPCEERVLEGRVVGLFLQVRPVARRDDVDEGIDVDHSGVGIDASDRVHRGDCRTAQREPKGAARLVRRAVGRAPAPPSGHVGEERDLVDGREEVRSMHPGADILGSGTGVVGECLGKVRAERIEPVRITVMAHVPDRQHLMMVHGGDEGVETREVVARPALDERPRDALPCDRDPSDRRKP